MQIRLKLLATASDSSAWRSGAAAHPSVAMKANMVAMLGSSIAAPFATPTIEASPIWTDESFVVVSVVRIAVAKAPGSVVSLSFAAATPATTRSTGSTTPIGPVEATRTSSTSQDRAFAAAAAVVSTATSPSAPVHALALPLFTTMARAFFPKRARDHLTQAAAAPF
jgi:hypothetical protein